MTFLDTGHHSKIELTPEEMLIISQEISINFAPKVPSKMDNDVVLPNNLNDSYPQTGKDKAEHSIHPVDNKLSTNELNEISEEISRCFAPKVSATIPELFLLPVDPHHLYAYWDIGDNKSHFALENETVKNLTLRIYWRPDINPAIKSSNVWFDVAADNPESRQNIRLPIDDTAYSAALGKLNEDNSLDVLATSNIISVPPAPGRVRIAPYRGKRDQPMSDPKSQTVSAAQKQATPDGNGPLCEDSLSNSQIKDELYAHQKKDTHFPEQGWFVKLHLSYPFTHNSDTGKIERELMTVFNEKGIGIELIPETGLIESSNILRKNASGQGI